MQGENKQCDPIFILQFSSVLSAKLKALNSRGLITDITDNSSVICILRGNRGSELADTLSPDLVFIELTL